VSVCFRELWGLNEVVYSTAVFGMLSNCHPPWSSPSTDGVRRKARSSLLGSPFLLRSEAVRIRNHNEIIIIAMLIIRKKETK
jgi:hypothetical protein